MSSVFQTAYIALLMKLAGVFVVSQYIVNVV